MSVSNTTTKNIITVNLFFFKAYGYKGKLLTYTTDALEVEQRPGIVVKEETARIFELYVQK